MTEKKSLNRRGFLQTSGAVAGAAMAASAFPHPAVGNVKGANEKLNFAILGAGGRMQAHIKVLLDMKQEGQAVDIVGMNDVWDGNDEVGRGLYPSAKKAGLDINNKDSVTKDYRRLLDRKDIDGVVIGTPDHWHARMTIDALNSGKHVYCEKPMTHTIDEARQVAEAVGRTGKVMIVGVQSMADPRWAMINDQIVEGRIGKVLQGQTSYYRNSTMGQWRYYPLTADMNPSTVDWKMFLGTDFGLAPEMPFNRAKYAQWRCYWPFGGGMYTDLFVHQLSHLIRAMGVRFPSRVVGGGGLYMEYDGRDCPDVATVVADYDEGCQVLISATMCNDVQLGEVIRGHTGTVLVGGGPKDGYRIVEQQISGRPAPPGANRGDGGELFNPEQPRDDTRALWNHFIECVRSENPDTLCPASLGYAAITTVNMGVDSYRFGKALFFNRDTGEVSEADGSWAAKWEERSKLRGLPNQVQGWKVDQALGSTLTLPDYQKLEGDWVAGKDPAKA